MMLFLVKASFDVDGNWDKGYYVWRAASDLALFLALFFKHKDYRVYLWPIIIFLIVRLCVEITTIFTVMKANDPKMVFILWLILTAGITFLSIREIYHKVKRTQEEWEQN